jgi:hypothetical protein
LLCCASLLGGVLCPCCCFEAGKLKKNKVPARHRQRAIDDTAPTRRHGKLSCTLPVGTCVYKYRAVCQVTSLPEVLVVYCIFDAISSVLMLVSKQAVSTFVAGALSCLCSSSGH